jgi:hypothetical protein
MLRVPVARATGFADPPAAPPTPAVSAAAGAAPAAQPPAPVPIVPLSACLQDFGEAESVTLSCPSCGSSSFHKCACDACARARLSYALRRTTRVARFPQLLVVALSRFVVEGMMYKKLGARARSLAMPCAWLRSLAPRQRPWFRPRRTLTSRSLLATGRSRRRPSSLMRRVRAYRAGVRAAMLTPSRARVRTDQRPPRRCLRWIRRRSRSSWRWCVSRGRASGWGSRVCCATRRRRASRSASVSARCGRRRTTPRPARSGCSSTWTTRMVCLLHGERSDSRRARSHVRAAADAGDDATGAAAAGGAPAELVAMITSMGFSERHAVRALAATVRTCRRPARVARCIAFSRAARPARVRITMSSARSSGC